MSEFVFLLEWEMLGNEGVDVVLVIECVCVFGGWLVCVGISFVVMVLIFVYDGEGCWDGEDFGVEDYEEDEDDFDEEDDEG
ncbi:DNA primase, partial [Xanthomonas citri pv. citri]|nr:DNA primase [Xanthomonas citri pv. citri]